MNLSRAVLPATLMALVLSLAVVDAPTASAGPPESPAFVPGEVLIVERPGAASERIENAIHGARQLKRIDSLGLRRVALPEGVSVQEAVRRYSALRWVKAAEPNFALHGTAVPNDPCYATVPNVCSGISNDTQAWYYQLLQAPTAWGVETGDSSLVVATIDTGIDLQHPDLDSNLWTNPGEIAANGVDDDGSGAIDDLHGAAFVTSPSGGCSLPAANNPDDDNLLEGGHGTRVSGIIGAETNNLQGVSGVSWDVQLMAVKALDCQASGTIFDAAEAIDYAAGEGARVINMSFTQCVRVPCLTGPCVQPTPPFALWTAVQQAQDQHDVTFVAAAGNDGCPYVGYPAAFPEVIAVGASGGQSSPNSRASFSNYGPEIDLSAPGDDVCSTAWDGAPDYACGLAGTSYSSPLATGLAALLLSYNPSLTSDALRTCLTSSAMDLGAPGFDNEFGYGRLQMSAALATCSGVQLVGDFDGDGATDAAAYHEASGGWWVNISNGINEFEPQLWTTFSTKTGWGPFLVGDFNGDAKDDVASYHSPSGRWWVNVSNGSAFTPQLWATFRTKTGWETHLVGDFDGDNRDDVVSYHPGNGTWWVNRSTGSAFQSQLWNTFTTKTGWETHLVGDFDGDSRDDVVSYYPGNGTWWVNRSTGSAFQSQLWNTFTTKTGWQTHLVGDFDGAGGDDVVSYHPSNGSWWVNRSTGSAFQSQLWSTFNTKTGWQTHLVGDFNNDGKLDTVSYYPGNGSWWVNLSNGSAFQPQLWATFSTKDGWGPQLIGDFNGDGRHDVLNFHAASGRWWVNVSTGAAFDPQLWRG